MKRQSASYDLIVLAASAGGIPALQRILSTLSPSLGVPIVIVQHRTANIPSLLANILDRASTVHVKQAEQGETLRTGLVYVAPPDLHLVVQPDRTFRFTDGTRIKHLLSSANPLLESAARVLGSRVIAVVLTGTGSDATDGVQSVKEAGGIVIAQDPSQAAYPGMPAAAIATGAVDYIVPLEDIPPLLLRLTSGKGLPEPRSGVLR
jgi:two-component system chemotaxis response regulator CheB